MILPLSISVGRTTQSFQKILGDADRRRRSGERMGNPSVLLLFACHLKEGFYAHVATR